MNKRVADRIKARFVAIFGEERIDEETMAGFEALAEMLHEGHDGLFVAHMLDAYINEALLDDFARSVSADEMAMLQGAIMMQLLAGPPPLPSFLPSEVPPKAKASLERELKRRKVSRNPGRN